jgi:hypothetical protein
VSLADAAQAGPRQARILTIDIETRPITAHTWGLFNQNIGLNQIVDPGGVMCFAAKWVGERTVYFYSDHHDDHRTMLEHAHRLLSEADIVVGYNSDRFDLTKLQWEFAQAGMLPPRPYKTVDLLKVARARFGAPSRKLDFIAEHLGLGNKVHHQGFTLWTACMAGDGKAWDKMRRYNIGDVRLTERLYHRLLPWVPNHPNMQLILDDDGCCPTCGGKRLKRDGETLTALTAYAMYQCTKCGARLRTNYIKRRVTHRPVK